MSEISNKSSFVNGHLFVGLVNPSQTYSCKMCDKLLTSYQKFIISFPLQEPELLAIVHDVSTKGPVLQPTMEQQ